MELILDLTIVTDDVGEYMATYGTKKLWKTYREVCNNVFVSGQDIVVPILNQMANSLPVKSIKNET